MSADKIIPTAMILLNLSAAAVYAWKGDSTRTVYMVAAAILNAAITYPLPRFPWSN